MNCPLCQSTDCLEIWTHKAWNQERFHHCGSCDAVFVHPDFQSSLEVEKARYESHNNDESSRGFVEFLMQTVREIDPRLPKGARILDFGSGPEPLLSRLLMESGFSVVSYDPFFCPTWPTGQFDLVLVHEVFEHLREPRQELQRLRNFMNPSGTLLIRSEICPERSEFAGWWYARDFTHLFFCSQQTLEWIAQNESWTLDLWSRNLWAFTRAKPSINS